MGLSHIDIAHRWAKGDVPERGLRGHHVYADRDTIYSYGPHFPIATKRDGVVLFNVDKRSVSTSRHQHQVDHALAMHNVAYFSVPHSAWGDAVAGAEYYKEHIHTIIGKWHRARLNKWVHMRHGRQVLGEFRRYCAFHKIDFDKMLQRDAKLALSCAIIALNPGE